MIIINDDLDDYASLFDDDDTGDLENPPLLEQQCFSGTIAELPPPVHDVIIPVRRGRTDDEDCRLAAEDGNDDYCVRHHQQSLHNNNGNGGTFPISSLEDVDGDDAPLRRRSENDAEDVRRSRRPHHRKPAVAPQVRTAPLRYSLSQEGRQRRRRQKLLNSRCVRGFLGLCVYGMLVTQQHTLMETATGTMPLVEPTATLGGSNNATTAATTVRRTAAAKIGDGSIPLKTGPMPPLPKFHRRKRPVFSPTIPPNAVGGVTVDDSGTTTHWHKIPPDPPAHPKKKRRPILSAAMSNRAFEEPLIFGKELPNSFVVESSQSNDSSSSSESSTKTRRHHHRHHHGYWVTSLIWLSLVALVVDTSYREWQYYQWHQQFLISLTTTATEEESPATLSSMQRRQRNSVHYRRSPSPLPGGRGRTRRFDSL